MRFFNNSAPDEKELLIIDGGSKDRTKEIVKYWQRQNDNIFLLDNPDKYVPNALNLGIKHSSGDPIIRLDAHSEYDQDYIKQILDTFNNTDSDIAGGPMRPIGKTKFQMAVAIATMNKFGIGGSKIHNIKYTGYSDHVYLGAWKRSLFSEVGYFDTRFKRNQDDEFDYRAKSIGKKIYLSSAIKSYYHPRRNILLLIKQYFQYGLFKPMVLMKIPSEMKFRHIIPACFILYLICLIPGWKFLLFFSPLIFYILLLIRFSFFNSEKISIKLFLLIIYPAIHISYGSGFIVGLLKVIKTDSNRCI